jgi:hypothetical protein
VGHSTARGISVISPNLQRCIQQARDYPNTATVDILAAAIERELAACSPLTAEQTDICDVCQMDMAAHGPTLEHPPAFNAGRAYERKACSAAAAEREVCALIAEAHIRRAATITDKEFADGYSFAAQEITAAIRARIDPTTTVVTTEETQCPKRPPS